MKRIMLVTTLLIGSLTTSGCQQALPEKAMVKPLRPTLTEVYEVDDKVCFSKPDATKLGLYILSLERGYN
ncbi:TPA: hypothetical protein RU419_004240 [Escherichia coli]|uniref:O-spanin n=2 Tax=Vectrevirus TaxID=2732928 RepID=A0A2H4YDN0_9CAUD|nr:hypothetical protein [Yersinia pseudotuberculosis]YP_009796118.1 Rz-like spanin [Escherichia phage VEc3]AUE22279.1 hypothetical protein vec3_53 [Escherichia phage VEc3]HDZ9878388.1 hypothetical protein [Escherichia coli]